MRWELSDDQAKSSSSLVKKLKSKMNLTFKFCLNEKQFEINTGCSNTFLRVLLQSLNLRTRITKNSCSCKTIARVAETVYRGIGAADYLRRTGFESNRRLNVFVWRENFVRHLPPSSDLQTSTFSDLANFLSIT